MRLKAFEYLLFFSERVFEYLAVKTATYVTVLPRRRLLSLKQKDDRAHRLYTAWTCDRELRINGG